MSEKETPPTPGEPDPARVKRWEESITRALQKERPAEGWPERKPLPRGRPRKTQEGT